MSVNDIKLAVVILNWNGRKFLEEYLPSVINFTNQEIAKIYVIDNASIDESVAYLQAFYPQVEILQNSTNLGFAGGYNEGLRQIDAAYYCLLNSDVEVAPRWVEDIIEFMDKHQNVAVCQPKILSYCQKDKFEYAGAAGGFIDKYGYPFCRGRIFMTLEEDKHQYDDVAEIFWATGACMFVRANLYHELGGLDDDFFAHMEEIDFCWRVKNHGYKVMCVPTAFVYHYGGGTLPKSSSQKTYLNYRNNLTMIYKNIPDKRICSVFFVRFIYDIIAAFRFLLDSGINDFSAVFKAYLHFWKSHKENKDKRKQISNKKEVSMIYTKSIVWQYFFSGKRKFSDIDLKDFTH